MEHSAWLAFLGSCTTIAWFDMSEYLGVGRTAVELVEGCYRRSRLNFTSTLFDLFSRGEEIFSLDLEQAEYLAWKSEVAPKSKLHELREREH